jgi:uncharacterized protein
LSFTVALPVIAGGSWYTFKVSEYQKAQTHWEQGQFWEVHEVLEPLWLRLSGPDREFAQGVILLAAALHKAKTSPSGGWRNYHKALNRFALAGRSTLLAEETKKALEQTHYRPKWKL